jgi:hypothetical protein
VHIHGNWTLTHTEVQAYFDIEGIPDRDFQYLIGLVIVEGTKETSYSFWADSEQDQEPMFIKFVETISQYASYTLFHFGSYETKALRQMKGRLPEPYKHLLGDILTNCVNILSIIHPHVYFPTYSNGLKDIGSYLGCQWTDERASGIQSIVWRCAWERQPNEAQKNKLIQYNAEDCQALKEVVGFIIGVSQPPVANHQGETQARRIVNTAEFQPDPGRVPVRWKAEYALPDFEYANKCAYFDYQRDKVFIRTNRNLRKSRETSKKARRHFRRVNKRVELKLTRCLLCGSKKIKALTEMTKQVVDLRFFRSGVRRCVTEFLSWRYQCDKCSKDFIPPEVFPNAPKYGHSLICWCVYQNVVCGQNLLKVANFPHHPEGLHTGSHHYPKVPLRLPHQRQRILPLRSGLATIVRRRGRRGA